MVVKFGFDLIVAGSVFRDRGGMTSQYDQVGRTSERRRILFPAWFSFPGLPPGSVSCCGRSPGDLCSSLLACAVGLEGFFLCKPKTVVNSDATKEVPRCD